MRPAGSRCRSSALVAVILAAVLSLPAAVAVLLGGPAQPALAAAPLTVSVDRGLGLTDQAVTLTIVGEVSEPLKGSKLVVRIKGPADSVQVAQGTPELHEGNKVVQVLGEAATGQPAEGAATAGTTPAAAAGTPQTVVTSTDAELEAGVLKATVTLPAGMPARPGAYLLVVEVKTAGGVVANGQVWVGKVAPREKPLDLAFVLPLSLGIHRNADGVFYDQVLEQAVASGGSNSGDLSALLGLPARFPGWDLTLAVEPVLLTQLRDMADGYARLDASGKKVEVGKDDPAALNAGTVLSELKSLGGDSSVEFVAGPYSGADLGILAAEGWRDGFEQVQMGKQELQQALDLTTPLTGALSPGLGLTTDSLGYYAEASIDHVVVGSQLAGLLTEPIEEGAVAVRARDDENNRVTLVFASSGIGACMTPPWDPGTFYAALAAELAAGSRDALVVVPAMEFTLPPAAYLESLGGTLQGLDWVRTRTLSALLRSYSPGTRPILLKTGAAGPQGYIEESLQVDVQSAHTAVTDLAAVADAAEIPLESAHRLLYMAEGRWWTREKTSPEDATVGLKYAQQARSVAQGELDKVRLAGAGSTVIIGREGTVDLTVENGATYPLTVELRLSGSGVTLPGGEQLTVDLKPGRTEVPVKVVVAEGSHQLAAQLVAGTSTLDEYSHSLRFVTLATILPGVVVGAIAIGVGVYFLVRWYLKRRRVARPA